MKQMPGINGQVRFEGNDLIHGLGKSKLGIHNRTALVIQGCELRRLELAESVKRHDPGKLLNADKLRFPNTLVKHARKNVDEH